LCKRKLKIDSLAHGVISAYGSFSDGPANHHRYQLKLLSLPISVQCASSQTPLPKYIVALSFICVWVYQVDVCLRFSNQALCLWISHVPPLTFWSYHPNNIVRRTSIMRIAFIYFNIVHAMHDVEFIRLSLHAQKCEHNRCTLSYMFGHFLSSIISYVDSLYVIFSILFPIFSEYHMYYTILHILLMASKVFVTNTNV
jgi:hypothetical protein